jgi:2-polyprenyl-6-methoxyphenol hydroxylase-like FAD-dependent oxidoreductase
MNTRFDVIVVGARCAGSALAYHLARAGMSVVMVDAARMPSGQSVSTHLIQPPGMDELETLGVAARVRELAPALRQFRLSFDEHEALLSYGPGRAARCLRRETGPTGSDPKAGRKVSWRTSIAAWMLMWCSPRTESSC